MIRAAALALSLVGTAAVAQDRPVVATVNYPLAYFAERLGGGAVDVLFPAPPDRDPALWRPGLADIAAIQAADVVALNGAAYADWVAKVSLPRSRIVDTSAGFADAYVATETITHSHGADGAHSHAGTASHTWLDPAQAAMQADALAAAMSRRIPELAQGIEANRAALAADLAALADRAAAATAALRGTTVLATHPRYQYLARAYGFDVEAVSWEPGAMPGDAQWAELAALAGRTGATTLLWEAAPPDGALARAADLGLASVVFPPLANRPAEGDYLSVMGASLDALAAGG